MGIPLTVWLLWEIPACIAVTALVYSLGLKKLPWRKVIMIGLLQAGCTYLIRLLPLTPGVNIFIEILVLALLFVWLADLDVRIALICCMLSTFLLLVLTGGSNLFSQHLGIYSEDNLQNNYYLQSVKGYPLIMTIFLLAILNQKTKNNLFNTVWKFILK